MSLTTAKALLGMGVVLFGWGIKTKTHRDIRGITITIGKSDFYYKLAMSPNGSATCTYLRREKGKRPAKKVATLKMDRGEYDEFAELALKLLRKAPYPRVRKPSFLVKIDHYYDDLKLFSVKTNTYGVVYQPDVNKAADRAYEAALSLAEKHRPEAFPWRLPAVRSNP